MTSSRELLALRKEVLVARAALQRHKIGRDLDLLREDLRWPRAVAAIASSPAVRSALFGVLLLAVGGGRLARLVRAAAGLVAVVKLAGLFARPAPDHAPGGDGAQPPGAKP